MRIRIRILYCKSVELFYMKIIPKVDIGSKTYRYLRMYFLQKAGYQVFFVNFGQFSSSWTRIQESLINADP